MAVIKLGISVDNYMDQRQFFLFRSSLSVPIPLFHHSSSPLFLFLCVVLIAYWQPISCTLGQDCSPRSFNLDWTNKYTPSAAMWNKCIYSMELYLFILLHKVLQTVLLFQRHFDGCNLEQILSIYILESSVLTWGSVK